MTRDLDLLLDRVRTLRRGRARSEAAPHKLLLVLAIARLYELDPGRPNRFPIVGELDREFSQACRDVFGVSDGNRILIEYPYIHLTNDGMWSLVIREGKEQEFRDFQTREAGRLTRSRIVDTVEYGSLSDDLHAAFADPASREAITAALIEELDEERPAGPLVDDSREGALNEHSMDGNPFVSYLNSLQRLSAANENALAEFQSRNPMFGRIHVPHPVTDRVLQELTTAGGRHVVLTGHAGDGKSTIAVSVYRRLMEIAEDQPLEDELRPREELPGGIVILKDLSERSRAADSDLMEELLGGPRRFLIVSNTGALLDFLRAQGPSDGDGLAVESEVLDQISKPLGEGELNFGEVRLLVLNLAQIDNLEIARQIFERMIAEENWEGCTTLACKTECPIFGNVDLINRRRDVVIERLFLAYRRMYEYGTRLTLRQITEHLAYLLTSGLDEDDMAKMRARSSTPLAPEFMFYNRFFGDDGRHEDSRALQLRGVREARRQAFGSRPSPTWERKLWLKQHAPSVRLGVEECDHDFEELRQLGSKPGGGQPRGLNADQAREQVRRMLFFLHVFDKQDSHYLSRFLNSPSILHWLQWQQNDPQLHLSERKELEDRIFHVLQEHFTGVRLPEGSRSHDRRLYVTLSRRGANIRQSAQVVVAQVDWNLEFGLELEEKDDPVGGLRRDLALQGKGRLEDVSLTLTLPFLDYVLMRHFGEVGEPLEASYVERLERFKAQIQEKAAESRARVMLVRLGTDHSFRRQQYEIRNGRLEVADV